LSAFLLNDKPWFLNSGKTSCYTHHTFLLGFPTGWSFTTHKESSGAVKHAPAANFLAPLSGIEEEEAPTSTTLSHVNLAPSK
jgi:hypothetical protein